MIFRLLARKNRRDNAVVVSYVLLVAPVVALAKTAEHRFQKFTHYPEHNDYQSDS